MAEERVTGFKSVMNLRQPRSWQAALGFYAFHSLIIILLGGIAGAITVMVVGYADKDAANTAAMHAGAKVAIVYATAAYGRIVFLRKMMKHPGYIVAFLGTILLAMLGGALLGLIPAAVTLGMQFGDTAGKPPA